MDVAEFYATKRREHAKLVKALLKGDLEAQPPVTPWINPETEEEEDRPEAVYLTSVRKREAGTTSGQVCLVPIWTANNKPGLASERIADGTHRISTKDEILAYLRNQLEQKKLHDSQDVNNNLKRMQIVGASEINSIPEHLRALGGVTEKSQAGSKAK